MYECNEKAVLSLLIVIIVHLNQIPRCWYERIHYALQKYYILMIYQSILNKMYSI